MGRPKGYSPAKADEQYDATKTSAAKLTAEARKQSSLADMHELNYLIKSRQYLPRADFQEASATLMAQLTQSLRSIPDRLERKYALAPEITQAIGRDIDTALNVIADKLALLTEDEPQSPE